MQTIEVHVIITHTFLLVEGPWWTVLDASISSWDCLRQAWMVAIMPVSDPLSSLRYWLITVEGNRRSMVITYLYFVSWVHNKKTSVIKLLILIISKGPEWGCVKLTNSSESFRFHASMFIYVLGCYMTNFIKTLWVLPYMTYTLVWG